MPGTVLGSEETTMNKTYPNPCLYGFIPMMETDNNENIYLLHSHKMLGRINKAGKGIQVAGRVC